MKPQSLTQTSLYKLILVCVMLLFITSAWMPALSASASVLEAQASFTQLSLYPNIETVGVVLSGTNLPKTAEMMYRQSNESTWKTGHYLMRIDDGRLVGSLFGLSPATSYEVKVFDGVNEINNSVTTQSDNLQFTPVTILHVDDDALPGGDGSATTPFESIQEGVNHATPGTQVLVADGVYHEAVTFPNSGTDGNWIQVKAQGSGAILDGSETVSGDIWQEDDKAKIWFAKMGPPFGYLARDQKRFYNYDDLSSLKGARGHNNESISEGWFFERSTSRLYVRSQDNPANHTWQVPRLNHAFDVDGKDWLWVEGFEMQYYGTQLDGCGVCTKNASHLVIRNNRIHNVQLGVYINWTGTAAQGNDTRIEYNEIYDPPVNEWPWKAVKGTSMEGTAIVLRGHIGAIVRGNELHNFFNGIYTGSSGALENPELAFDIDVYNNHIHHISDDALEPEGACINHRFRNNTIDSAFVGVSLAPVTQGPTWVLRSTFTNYTGRGIKWDGNSDGKVLIYHNTFWTPAQDIAAMDFISPAHNATLRNNIFQNTSYAIYEVRTGSSGHDWNFNNWYTPRNPPFKWENVEFANSTALCQSTGLECNSYTDVPGLANPGGSDLSLSASSPNIDRGVFIPGINDNFISSAPDIGAFEYTTFVDLPPRVVSILRANENPTNTASINFTVTFSEAVTGIDLAPPFSDFALTSNPGIIGASITGITPVSETIYTITLSTGSGSGTIRLDLVDDNSIIDATGNPLGGPNPGDGNFNTGEIYDLNRTAPSVTGSLRTAPSPSPAESVNFTVTFSETVIGVDNGDFALTTTGNIISPFVSNVSGTGNSYNITVNTGSGDGGLRLDLLDNDSITNASGIPLGGPGTGNGSFVIGDAYMIDKTAPTVTGSLRGDSTPTFAETVNFTVVFSEPVSGVDARDFFPYTSGDISSATVTNVSGSGYLYTISVSTGSGNGTLRLDILDDDSILDAAGQPLSGLGYGNGNFTTGEEYTVQKLNVTPVVETFRSNGRYDGWVLESSENSNRGDVKDPKSATFALGDDKNNRQYIAILDFPTDALPDNAVITRVLLMIREADMAGTNPFTTHQNIAVDIRSGAFGFLGPFRYRGLQASDFQSPSDRDAVGVIENNPYSGWYWSYLDSSSFAYVNRYGNTQIRLRFQIDDDNDFSIDYLRFYSGDYSNVAFRPRFLIEYYVK